MKQKLGRKHKHSFHGVWLLLGAAGLGYLLGSKRSFKGILKGAKAGKKESENNLKQGWYGIVDDKLEKEFKETINKQDSDTNANISDKAVEVEQKVINGFQTETTLKWE